MFKFLNLWMYEWGGGVPGEMLLQSIMLDYAYCALKSPDFALHISLATFIFSKGKSSNNFFLVWAPNRCGPFKTEQQNRSQRIELTLLIHKLLRKWQILRISMDSFFKNPVNARKLSLHASQRVIMFTFLWVAVCLSMQAEGEHGLLLGFRCDGAEC